MATQSSTDPNKDKVIHEYDGIQECDNALPNWWLGILYGTIAFGAIYWLSAESFKTTPSPRAEYHAEMEKIAAEEAAKMKAIGSVSDESLLAMAKDTKALDDGKGVFASTCAPCHAANGGGSIGPNLTDANWLHGGAPMKIYGTIKDGFTAKGMPAWGPALGEERVRAVAAYVVSLKNTNVAGGKAPQGDPEQ
ncbi:MAG: c-type cytochrome [Deltaproteobacteria bacterium]|nr:c-type cytochrome [Deltaproteobacteria bacterium]